VRYSLVEGSGIDQDNDGDGWNGFLGVDGGGNRDADPLFADADGPDGDPGTPDDDLRLRSPDGGSSPAIDAGDNGSVPAGRWVDRAGRDRFTDVPGVPDTGVGSPPLVDLGAFESDGAPLPVELVAFRAAAVGSDVVLSWETLSETNNAGFEVQSRPDVESEAPGASGTARRWTTLGFVPGRGTTDRRQTYRYRCPPLTPGTYAFRLRQVDVEGTVTLSRPVTARVAATEGMVLHPPAPNPARGSTVLRFAVSGSDRAVLRLYDILGREVATLYDGSPRTPSLQTVDVSVSHLPSGTYFARLTVGATTRAVRLSVVR
jgi:hypothetical protein